MRRIYTIPVILLLTLAGMNFSVASHYCQGDLAATVISIDGRTHVCCMDYPRTSSPQTTISAECCKDDIRVYHVGNDYTPSEIVSGSVPLIVGCILPEALHANLKFSSLPIKANGSPPEFFQVSEVSAAEICVFLI